MKIKSNITKLMMITSVMTFLSFTLYSEDSSAETKSAFNLACYEQGGALLTGENSGQEHCYLTSHYLELRFGVDAGGVGHFDKAAKTVVPFGVLETLAKKCKGNITVSSRLYTPSVIQSTVDSSLGAVYGSITAATENNIVIECQ